MNADWRGSVPIGECTSDNRVRVRREAVPRQTRTPSYVVGCLAVAVRPHQRPPGPEGLGANREDPPDRHAPIGIAEGWHVHAHANPRSGVAPASLKSP